MQELKYIIIDDFEFIIFPNYFTHAEMAQKLKGNKDITSAGFINMNNNKVNCYGESISLKLKSKKVDSRIINGYIFDN